MHWHTHGLTQPHTHTCREPSNQIHDHATALSVIETTQNRLSAPPDTRGKHHSFKIHKPTGRFAQTSKPTGIHSLCPNLRRMVCPVFPFPLKCASTDHPPLLRQLRGNSRSKLCTHTFTTTNPVTNPRSQVL